MWKLWDRSKKLRQRPSSLLDVDDKLAAYLFDSAVVTLGTLVENALMETYEIGSGEFRETRQRYTLLQLLDPEFTLPLPEEGEMRGPGMASVESLKGIAGVMFDEVG